MIKIEKLNKYYNRHKKNQIHVINNTSLELPDTGLIALLGPSGCGKTTLLNAIGGLDKVNSGKIYLNNKKITTKCTYKKDKLRNLHIGYIFQDYKLVDDKSVYDNVAMVLRMIGIKDKKEVKKRVVNTGKPIGPEDRKKIDAALRGETTAGTHLGLANIADRLRLIYSGQAAIEVSSDEKDRTVVRMDVPQDMD